MEQKLEIEVDVPEGYRATGKVEQVWVNNYQMNICLDLAKDPPKKKAREWWVGLDAIGRSCYFTSATREPDPPTYAREVLRVREVIDE